MLLNPPKKNETDISPYKAADTDTETLVSGLFMSTHPHSAHPRPIYNFPVQILQLNIIVQLRQRDKEPLVLPSINNFSPPVN